MTIKTALWKATASELAACVASGEVTALDVTKAHLQRIAETNGALNAVTVILNDQALEAAKRVDAMIAAGESPGPLAGVPITIKENLDCVGSATTHGLPALAEALPAANAPIVDRVLAAGAIPIGRTNLPDFALRLHTDSALHGATKNPWDATRTTGGSSGGEGAALAAGMSALGLGNDIGGSLRNPAHCCGIASIRPTQGVIPRAQTIPFEDEGIAFQLMNTDGPMARNVADVRLLFDVMRGAHPRDPLSLSPRFTDVPTTLRIGVMPTPPGGGCDERISQVVRNAAAALAQAGHTVEEVIPPDFEQIQALWSDILDGDVALSLPLMEALLSKDALTFINDFRDGRAAPSAESLAQSLSARVGLARKWSLFFEDYDVLLSPTWTELPFSVGWDIEQPGRAQATMQQARCVLPANVMGLPSVCAPAGLVDGLPVGLLVTGARFSDYICLHAAEIIESQSGVKTPLDVTD